eukprot:1852903-Rhodomonas_salina.1
MLRARPVLLQSAPCSRTGGRRREGEREEEREGRWRGAPARSSVVVPASGAAVPARSGALRA